MLMDEFNSWRLDPNNGSSLGEENSENNFSIFYQQYSVGKGFMTMLSVLAHQVYELQVVVEGLIEDIGN